MLAPRGTLRVGVASEEHAETLAAAPPVLLDLVDDVDRKGVVAAALLGVLPAGRTVGAGVAPEKQPLALAAPAPARLPRGTRRVLNQCVVAARLLRVLPTGRALRAGVAAEEQPLALAAPAPA